MSTHHTPNTPVTIDDLALMIGKGFNDVDQRFKQVDKRFEQIDRRFEAIELNMATKKDIERLDKSIHRLEMKFDAVEETIYRSHSPRIHALEKKFV